jgi:hypothetical protein
MSGRSIDPAANTIILLVIHYSTHFLQFDVYYVGHITL